MQERETGQLRRDDPRHRERTGGDQYDEYTEGGGTSMTHRSATKPERQQDEWSASEPGGGWTGYVVPYRYYGPGYRGVGYYSVMYQGAGERPQQDAEGQDEQRGSRYGQRPGWTSGRGDLGGRQFGGGFAGRGPKGYQRSDERLREEVSDRLMADDQIDASDVEVDVRNGEVTLTGTVPDRWAKRRAEDCAEQVMGVRDVMNQIRVKGGSREGSGAESGGSSQQTTGSKSRSAEPQPASPNGRRRATTSSR